jgi:Flp pilus assembly protein TadD
MEKEQPSSTAADSEKLLKAIAVRFTLIFFIPLVAIVGISIYAYSLATRLNEVEALALVMNTERVLQTDKNNEWAIQSYQKIKEKYPRPEVYARLGALHYAQGNKKSAYEVLDQAKKPSAEYWEIYTTLAYLYLADQREKDAVEAGETALKLKPDDVQTLNNLAWVYATTNDGSLRNLEKARAYALKAVKLTNGQQSNYLDTLAEIYFRNGEKAAALKTIQRAIDKERRDVVYLEGQLKRFQFTYERTGR